MDKVWSRFSLFENRLLFFDHFSLKRVSLSDRWEVMCTMRIKELINGFRNRGDPRIEIELDLERIMEIVGEETEIFEKRISFPFRRF